MSNTSELVARYLDLEFLINSASERVVEHRLNLNNDAAVKAQRFVALLHYTQSDIAAQMSDEEMAEAERLMAGETDY